MLTQVFDAQSRYGLPSAGSTTADAHSCRDATGKPTDCKQWFIRITDKRSWPDEPDRPQVFFSGNLHGNEEVGPQAVLVTVSILLGASGYSPRYGQFGDRENAVLQRIQGWTDAAGLPRAGTPWIRRLVHERVVVALPVSNAVGYSTHQREEWWKGRSVDPNRDFPVDSVPTCMETVVARAINEVWREHIFQMGVTFHGGDYLIGYEWGTVMREHTLSPDDVAQSQIAIALRDAAGKCTIQQDRYYGKLFDVGRMETHPYAVKGGMEDWAYAASWDAELVPSTCGQADYPDERIHYNNATLRAFNFLVEVSDLKAPPVSFLGGAQEMLRTEGKHDGHVPRNVRLSLGIIDLARPYVELMATKSQRACLVDGNEDEPNSPVSLTQDELQTIRERSQASTLNLAVPAYLKNATDPPTKSRFSTVTTSVSWDIGGAIFVDRTLVHVFRWPVGLKPALLTEGRKEDLPPAIQLLRDVLHGAADLDSLQGYRIPAVLGHDEVTVPFLAGSGEIQTGPTRWNDETLAHGDLDLANKFYVPRFDSEVDLPLGVHVRLAPSALRRTTASSEGELVGVGWYVLIVEAEVDSSWANKVVQTPPQAHAVRARTDTMWHAEHAGYEVKGRVKYFGVPQFVSVEWGLVEAPSPSPRPTGEPTPSPGVADPSASPSPSCMAPHPAPDHADGARWTAGDGAMVGLAVVAVVLGAAIGIARSRGHCARSTTYHRVEEEHAEVENTDDESEEHARSGRAWAASAGADSDVVLETALHSDEESPSHPPSAAGSELSSRHSEG